MKKLKLITPALAVALTLLTPTPSFSFSLSKLLGASSIKTSKDHNGGRSNVSSKDSSDRADPWRFYVSADYLYWKSTQQGLSFALTGCRNVANTTITSQGTNFTPEFSWNSGFKVGAGAYFNPQWDVSLRYTRYTSDNNKATCSDAAGNIQEGFILGTFVASNNFQSQCTFASSDWDLNFNTLDLELGRGYKFNHMFKVRPFAGLKFSYQKQNWNNLFRVDQMYFNGNSSNPLPGVVNSDQDHKTLATGIRIGGRGQWQLHENVSLFSTLALNGLWTHYDVNRKDTFTITSTGESVVAVDVKRNGSTANAIRAVSEFDLGINGSWDLPRNQTLDISVAYEMQMWINNSAYIFIINNTHSDLSLQGLNVRVRYGF